jgi:hypothetical protein
MYIIAELELSVKPFFRLSEEPETVAGRRLPPAPRRGTRKGKGVQTVSVNFPLPSLAARRDITLFSPGVNNLSNFF